MNLIPIDLRSLFVIFITLKICETFHSATLKGQYWGAIVETAGANLTSSVWKEHITDQNGVVIYRASRPVDGPRKSRYEYFEHASGSVLYISVVKYDDAGHYSYKDGNGKSGQIDLVFTGDHVCYNSTPHTVTEGTNLTYTCNFKYRGLRIEPIVWSGPGVLDSNKLSNFTKSRVPTGTECYNGTGTYSVTIQATISINQTNRTATQYGSVNAPYTYQFVTGLLTVRCKDGFGGSDCKTKLTCNDNPCNNGAVCTNVSGLVNCRCIEPFTGFYCTDAIPCSDGLCKNGVCSDVANASFYCQCEPGYYGVLCETEFLNKTATDGILCSDGLCKNGVCSDVANASFSCQCEPGYYGVLCETEFHNKTKLETTAQIEAEAYLWKSAKPVLLYALLLLLPIAAATILAVYFIKRRKKNEEARAAEEERSRREDEEAEEEEGFLNNILSWFYHPSDTGRS